MTAGPAVSNKEKEFPVELNSKEVMGKHRSSGETIPGRTLLEQILILDYLMRSSVITTFRAGLNGVQPGTAWRNHPEIEGGTDRERFFAYPGAEPTWNARRTGSLEHVGVYHFSRSLPR